MKKLILLSILFIVGCDNSTEPEEFNSSFNVRIANSMSDTIKIVISLANYGLIAPNDTTVYKSIYMGENEAYLNDSLFTINITGTFDPPPPENCGIYYLIEFYEHSFGETTYDAYNYSIENSNFDECWWSN